MIKLCSLYRNVNISQNLCQLLSASIKNNLATGRIAATQPVGGNWEDADVNGWPVDMLAGNVWKNFNVISLKTPVSTVDMDHHHTVLVAHNKTASRKVQPFLHISWLCTTHVQTTLCVRSVHCVQLMRPMY